MKINTKTQEPREAVLNIQLEDSEIESYLERAYRRVVQRANIPGFRKGKAPRRVVEQMFGREHLLGEALEFMIPEITNKAVSEEKLEIGGLPSVNVAHLDPPNIIATVPLVPNVDLGNYRQLKINKPKATVAKKRIEQEIERMRWAIAPWEPVETPVIMEDMLNVTVKGWAEGKEILNMERADYIPRPDARVPAPGFAESLIGMQAYETKDFTIAVPNDFEYSEIAGKDCKFEVLIHIVKRKAPEELTDEFAKGAGTGYESLSDMRAKIKAEFLRSEERLIDSRHQEEALEELQNKAKFEMSPLIIEHEIEHLLEDHQEALQSGRMSIEIYQQYLQWAGKNAEEIREAARPNAESRVKRSLILEKLSDENNLAVSDTELNSEIERLATETSTERDKIRELFQDPERVASLNRLLLNRKALSFLSDLTANASKTSPVKQSTIKKNSDKNATKNQTKKRETK